ncbi:MAG: sodium:proton antiporter, partial [Tannerellaceae bacterium]|nr:sodium:proton antiporter [Tannerellaceae bacterium]
MIVIFLIGYLLIALEHPLKLNKSGTALLTGTILWVLYAASATDFIPAASPDEFEKFIRSVPDLA